MDAQLIDAFIAHGLACNAIDAGKPLHVIDLAPDAGARAWHVLNATEDSPCKLRYRALCPTTEAAAAMLAHPFLQVHRATQRLEAVVWQGGGLGASALAGIGGNPFVILAHGAFGELAHELYACHYGELLEAWVSPAVTTETRLGWRASPRGVATGSATDVAIRELLAHYVATINSAALLVPRGAMECLQDLIDASGARYLLLASAEGVGNASAIRLGAMMPGGGIWSERERSPVNFDALARWQQASGAQVRTVGEGARVYQLAMRDAACPAMEEGVGRLLALRSPRETATQQLSALAASLQDQLSAEQAFVLLRASDDSPQVLLAVAQVLMMAAPELPGDALTHWRNALAHACAQYFPPHEDEGFLRTAAALAMGLESWGVAARLLEQSMTMYGATVHDMRMLAHSHQARGHGVVACSYMALACHEFPDDEMARHELEVMTARLAAWSRLQWYDPTLASAGPLHLQPLGPEHAAAFLYQYRDPQIGMMTRLPAFDTEEDLIAWMTERRAETSRADFAVMHEEYGFAGVVSANAYDGAAFFHFWIGVDFQGAGLGTQAARLLVAQLRASGIRYLLTAAYPDNVRSLRALAALGMQALDISALPPEEQMVFHGMELRGARIAAADPASGFHLCDVLRRYSMQSDSVFQFGG